MTFSTPSPAAPSSNSMASATTVQHVAPITASQPMGSTRRPKDSPQLQYSKAVARLPRFYRDEGGAIYEWLGSHFSVVSSERSERHAFDYLEQHFPDRATPQLARSCSDTLKIKAPLLPVRDVSRLIIPLRDAYLEVRPDGSIARHKPDKKFGVTYVLNTSLGGNSPTHVPVAPPVGSYVDKFLTSSIPDVELRSYVQELAGDTLTPTTRFQRAMLLKGSGANGKSVFMKVIAALHSQVASMRLNELHSFHLTPLVGASLVVVDEVPKFGINEQMLKTLISGEAVTIDRKHRDPIGYTPHAKWIIATNNDQKMQDNSFGLWRRLVTIPFNQQIAPNAVVPGLDRLIIENELNVLLDWCLIGLQRLLKRGTLPREPVCVVTAKRSAIEASNSVVAWSSHEEVGTSSACSAEKQRVYDDYRGWCQSQGLRAVSANVFWKELKELHPGLVDEQRRVCGERRQRFVNLAFPIDAVSSEHTNPFTNS